MYFLHFRSASCLLFAVTTVATGVSPQLAQDRHKGALPAFPVTAEGDRPQPCCSPLQFECTVGGVIGSPPRSVLMTYSMDMKNRRMAASGFMTAAGGATISVQVYQNGRESYTSIGGRCHFKVAPMLSNCLQKNATLLRSSMIGGGGGNSLKVNGWVLKPLFTSPQFSRLFVTLDKCLPVSSISGDAKEIMALDYYNISPGIMDPGVFKVPEACKKMEEGGVRYEWALDIFSIHESIYRSLQ